mmetsp:Transcript_3656/g.7123  ORF Transcript_3656/g.7123 Transcript_3656/m.7123 type:complete len:113 (-) Transcript_3656:11-349(-)
MRHVPEETKCGRSHGGTEQVPWRGGATRGKKERKKECGTAAVRATRSGEKGRRAARAAEHLRRLSREGGAEVAPAERGKHAPQRHTLMPSNPGTRPASAASRREKAAASRPR